jgi:hypothetical protein
MVNEKCLLAARRSPTRYYRGMRRLTIMLIITVGVSACGDIPIGPVDHECHIDPARSQGSGCENYHD